MMRSSYSARYALLQSRRSAVIEERNVWDWNLQAIMDVCRCCKSAHRNLPFSHLVVPQSVAEEDLLPESIVEALGDTSLSWFDDLTEASLNFPSANGKDEDGTFSVDGEKMWSPCPRGGVAIIKGEVSAPVSTSIAALLGSSKGSSDHEGKSRSSSCEYLCNSHQDMSWTSAMATPLDLGRNMDQQESFSSQSHRTQGSVSASGKHVRSGEDSALNEMEQQGDDKPKALNRKLFSPGQRTWSNDSLTRAVDWSVEEDITVEQEETICSEKDALPDDPLPGLVTVYNNTIEYDEDDTLIAGISLDILNDKADSRTQDPAGHAVEARPPGQLSGNGLDIPSVKEKYGGTDAVADSEFSDSFTAEEMERAEDQCVKEVGESVGPESKLSSSFIKSSSSLSSTSLAAIDNAEKDIKIHSFDDKPSLSQDLAPSTDKPSKHSHVESVLSMLFPSQCDSEKLDQSHQLVEQNCEESLSILNLDSSVVRTVNRHLMSPCLDEASVEEKCVNKCDDDFQINKTAKSCKAEIISVINEQGICDDHSSSNATVNQQTHNISKERESALAKTPQSILKNPLTPRSSGRKRVRFSIDSHSPSLTSSQDDKSVSGKAAVTGPPISNGFEFMSSDFHLDPYQKDEELDVAEKNLDNLMSLDHFTHEGVVCDSQEEDVLLSSQVEDVSTMLSQDKDIGDLDNKPALPCQDAHVFAPASETGAEQKYTETADVYLHSEKKLMENMTPVQKVKDVHAEDEFVFDDLSPSLSPAFHSQVLVGSQGDGQVEKFRSPEWVVKTKPGVEESAQKSQTKVSDYNALLSFDGECLGKPRAEKKDISHKEEGTEPKNNSIAVNACKIERDVTETCVAKDFNSDPVKSVCSFDDDDDNAAMCAAVLSAESVAHTNDHLSTHSQMAISADLDPQTLSLNLTTSKSSVQMTRSHGENFFSAQHPVPSIKPQYKDHSHVQEQNCESDLSPLHIKIKTPVPEKTHIHIAVPQASSTLPSKPNINLTSSILCNEEKIKTGALFVASRPKKFLYPTLVGKKSACDGFGTKQISQGTKQGGLVAKNDDSSTSCGNSLNGGGDGKENVRQTCSWAENHAKACSPSKVKPECTKTSLDRFAAAAHKTTAHTHQGDKFSPGAVTSAMQALSRPNHFDRDQVKGKERSNTQGMLGFAKFSEVFQEMDETVNLDSDTINIPTSCLDKEDTGKVQPQCVEEKNGNVSKDGENVSPESVQGENMKKTVENENDEIVEAAIGKIIDEADKNLEEFGEDFSSQMWAATEFSQMLDDPLGDQELEEVCEAKTHNVNKEKTSVERDIRSRNMEGSISIHHGKNGTQKMVTLPSEQSVEMCAKSKERMGVKVTLGFSTAASYLQKGESCDHESNFPISLSSEGDMEDQLANILLRSKRRSEKCLDKRSTCAKERSKQSDPLKSSEMNSFKKGNFSSSLAVSETMISKLDSFDKYVESLTGTGYGAGLRPKEIGEEKKLRNCHDSQESCVVNFEDTLEKQLEWIIKGKSSAQFEKREESNLAFFNVCSVPKSLGIGFSSAKFASKPSSICEPAVLNSENKAGELCLDQPYPIKATKDLEPSSSSKASCNSTLPGFTTAAGKDISLSFAAQDKAQRLWNSVSEEVKGENNDQSKYDSALTLNMPIKLDSKNFGTNPKLTMPTSKMVLEDSSVVSSTNCYQDSKKKNLSAFDKSYKGFKPFKAPKIVRNAVERHPNKPNQAVLSDENWKNGQTSNCKGFIKNANTEGISGVVLAMKDISKVVGNPRASSTPVEIQSKITSPVSDNDCASTDKINVADKSHDLAATTAGLEHTSVTEIDCENSKDVQSNLQISSELFPGSLKPSSMIETSKCSERTDKVMTDSSALNGCFEDETLGLKGSNTKSSVCSVNNALTNAGTDLHDHDNQSGAQVSEFSAISMPTVSESVIVEPRAPAAATISESGKGEKNDFPDVVEDARSVIANTSRKSPEQPQAGCYSFPSASSTGTSSHVSKESLPAADSDFSETEDLKKSYKGFSNQANIARLSVIKPPLAGKSVCVTDEALHVAKSISLTEAERLCQIKDSDALLKPNVSGFSTALEKPVSVTEEALQQAKSILNGEAESLCETMNSNAARKPSFSGFSTASGKSVSVTEKALQHVKGILVSEANNLCETKNSDAFFAARPNFSGFCTASGKSVSVTEEALQQAKSILNSEAESLCETMNSNAASTTSLSGFSTASGKSVSVSDHALNNANLLLHDNMEGLDKGTGGILETDPNLSESSSEHTAYATHKDHQHGQKMLDENVKNLSKPEKENIVPKLGFSGFSTASGSSVSVSKKALAHAKNLFNEEVKCGEDKSLVEAEMETENLTSKFPGFSTASGSSVSVSMSALHHARNLFDDNPVQCGKKVSQTSTLTGFSTASGAAVLVSGNGLSHAKQFFNDDFTKEDRTDKTIKVGLKLQGFSTASGMPVSVTEDAFEKAKSWLDCSQDGNQLGNAEAATELSKMSASSCAISETSHQNQKVSKHSEIPGCHSKTAAGTSLSSGKSCILPKYDGTMQDQCNLCHDTRGDVAKSDCGTLNFLPNCDSYTSSKVQAKFSPEFHYDRFNPKVKRMRVMFSKVLFDESGSDDNPIKSMDNIPTSFKPPYKNARPDERGDNSSPTQKRSDCETLKTESKHRPSFVPPPAAQSSSKPESASSHCSSYGTESNKIQNKPKPVFGQVKTALNSSSLPAVWKNKDLSRPGGNIGTSNVIEKSSTGDKTPVDYIDCDLDDDVENELLCREWASDGKLKSGPAVGSDSTKTIFCAKCSKHGDAPCENCYVESRSDLYSTYSTEEKCSSHEDDGVIRQDNDCGAKVLDSLSSCNTSLEAVLKRKGIQSLPDSRHSFGVTASECKKSPDKKAHTNSEDCKTGDFQTALAAKVGDLGQNGEPSIEYEPPNPSKISLCELEAACMAQDKVIRSKKRKKVWPSLGRWLQMRRTGRSEGNSLRSLESLNLQPESELSLPVLLSLGVCPSTIAVNSLNAKDFRFDLHRFFPSTSCGILVGDGAMLVPDQHGSAGAAEFYRCLTPDLVMLQLKYRYDREVDACHRSAIKKIVERDDTPGKRLVLCVASIDKQENTQVILEVTDGWYSIRAQIDSALSGLVSANKIRPGIKIVTSGAELVGNQGACSPLEIPESLMLKLSGNSTRPAPCHAKLGFCAPPSPLCVPLGSLSPHGGIVGCVDVVLSRKYPILYMEKLPDGACIFRSSEEEEKARRKHEDKRQEQIEKLYAALQGEKEQDSSGKGSRRARRLSKKEIEKLWSGQELADAMDTALNPEDFQQCLSSSQLERLTEYKRSEVDRKQQEMNRKLQEAMSDAGNELRNVTPVQKLRIFGCCRRDVDHNISCLVTVWRPGPDWADMTEGCRYRLYGLAVGPARGKSGGRNHVTLTASRQSRLQERPISDNLLDLIYEKREVWTVSDLRAQWPKGDEFDFVGLVVKIKHADKLSHPTVLYVCDQDQEMLSVRIWSGKQNNPTNLKQGQVICASSLFLVSASSRERTQGSALLTADAQPEFSTFSTSAHACRHSCQFMQMEQLAKKPDFLAEGQRLLEKMLSWPQALCSVHVTTCRQEEAGFSMWENNDEDFPPDVIEKIFSSMSQGSLGETTQAQHQTYHKSLLENPTASPTGVAVPIDPSAVNNATKTSPSNIHNKALSNADGEERRLDMEIKKSGTETVTSYHTRKRLRANSSKIADPCNSLVCDEDSSNRDSEILKKRKLMLRQKMSKLLAYDRPSPLTPLPQGLSPARRKDFKSPVVKKN
ncbi:breast cancer type 2 susceptibility-like protein [Plakobranchus ocellatus]|uniref:Breast cancer type 2 susceptibility-like protein n=1 Tax=Plakobranchus ocellatus TaxID=259542 RepID=A0AAV4AMT6_9GAST|nr:breast cancer type 2 susceptibility-like protein [Plakobranchus ocellatus]